jgi:predicted Zn-dependent peptidase
MRLADFEVAEPSPGFRVYVHPTPKFKTLVLSLHVHQPLGNEATRLALLPPILRRGCRGYPNLRKMVMFLEGLYGASFGGDVLKLGERQVLSFRFDTVNDRFAPRKIRALERALDFLCRVATEPVARAGALHGPYVDQEKENLRRHIEGMINDRMSYAYERCIEEMCRGEAFSRYEYGKLEEIPPVTAKDLHRLHARVLAESPIDLYVVGDVSPDRAVEAAHRTFRLGKRRIRRIPPTEVRGPLANGAREHVEKLDVEQGKVVIGCRTGTSWGHADTFPLVLYNGVLGAFPHSKLFANVREREGLAYAVHSSLDHTKGLLFVTAGIDPSKYAKCVEVIRRQMEDVAAGRITDDEWEKTRRTLADRVRSREDSPGGKIGAFAEMNLNGRPMEAAEIVGAIEAVSKEEVQRVAGRIKPDTIFFLTRP